MVTNTILNEVYNNLDVSRPTISTFGVSLPHLTPLPLLSCRLHNSHHQGWWNLVAFMWGISTEFPAAPSPSPARCAWEKPQTTVKHFVSWKTPNVLLSPRLAQGFNERLAVSIDFSQLRSFPSALL